MRFVTVTFLKSFSIYFVSDPLTFRAVQMFSNTFWSLLFTEAIIGQISWEKTFNPV